MGIPIGGGSATEANSAPDEGRSWQMLGFGPKFGHKKEQVIAPLSVQERGPSRPPVLNNVVEFSLRNKLAVHRIV